MFRLRVVQAPDLYGGRLAQFANVRRERPYLCEVFCTGELSRNEPVTLTAKSWS
jgi:hypothetical protein